MLKLLSGDIPPPVGIRNNKTVYIERLWRKEFSVDIRDIKRLYFRNPTFFSDNLINGYGLFDDGFVYISLDGDIEDNPLKSSQTFTYTRPYKRDVAKFVRQLQYINENIEVIQVKRYYNMHKDRAVNENRFYPICPSCQSEQVHYMGNQSKRFSVKKALVGGLLTGGIGAVAGFAGKKGPDQWQCSQCRNIFETHPR